MTAKLTDPGRAARVTAAHTAGISNDQATTSDYVDLAFQVRGLDDDGNQKTITEIPVEHAVSLLIFALASTQNGLVKVLGKVHPEWSAWDEIVSETTLTAGTDTQLFADTIRHSVIKVQIKESVAGGTVKVGLCAK